jgi:hypothetical protein
MVFKISRSWESPSGFALKGAFALKVTPLH